MKERKIRKEEMMYRREDERRKERRGQHGDEGGKE